MRSEVGIFVFSAALLCSRCLSACSDQAVCASRSMPAAGLLQMKPAENAKVSKVSTEEELRCCCHRKMIGKSSSSMKANPEYQKKIHPNNICVDPNETSKIYSISQDSSSSTFSGTEIQEWRTSAEITRSGQACSSTCTGGQINKYMFQYTGFDKLTKYDDPGLFMLGSALYKQAAATRSECRNEVCSQEWREHCECYLLLEQANVSAVSGRRRRRRRKIHVSHGHECEEHCSMRCHDRKVCQQHATVNMCGHTADRGLVHYEKVGNIGECIPESKWRSTGPFWSREKVCPSGMFHESRAAQKSSSFDLTDSKNVVCRCGGCE